MASIAKRPNRRWRARYRDAAGQEHSRERFATKKAAQEWLDGQTSQLVAGAHVDPRLGRVTVGEWAKKWEAGQLHLKATGRTRVEGILRLYVVPKGGTTKLQHVPHADVQTWVADLQSGGLSASSAQRAHGILA